MQAVGNLVVDHSGKTIATIVGDVNRPDLIARQFADSDEAFRLLRRIFDVFGGRMDNATEVERLLVTNGK